MSFAVGLMYGGMAVSMIKLLPCITESQFRCRCETWLFML